MQQITNQKFDSYREQLTQSINILHSYKQHNQLHQSSILEDSYHEQSDHEQNTFHSSIRRKKQQARVMQSQYMQDPKQHQATQMLINKIVMIQKNFRQHHFLKQFRKRLRQMKSRKCVVLEFHQIEKNYNEDLNIIINIIKEIETQQLLTQEELIQIFLNVQQISQLNQRFYNTIEQILKNYHHFVMIAQQFTIYVPFFKIYYDYCSRFHLDEVKKLRLQHPNFNQYIQIIENNGLLKGLTFESFLIKPVQQLPRYVLLIEKLVKFTESTHPDYNELKSLQEHFYKINQQINRMIDTTQINLKLLAQFGTLDQQEIEMIQKKQQEEEQFLKKLQQLLSIQVLTHFKQKNGFKSFIVYIIQIQISNYRTRIYHRFSDLLSIPSYIDIINLEPLQNGCFIFTSEDEIIEQRKEMIINFLNSLFLNPKLKKYQDQLIQLLDLPENILELEQNDSILMRGSYQTTIRNTILVEEEFEVIVHLADGKSVTLSITKTCRTLDLIDTVSRSIFLDKNLDFKIIIEQNNEYRVLDDNEVIFKVLQNYNQNKQNFLSKIFSNNNPPIFYLKKYLYLGYQIECQLYHTNKIRSVLLFYQELNELKNSNLTQQEYINLCALILCIFYEVDSLKSPQELRVQQFQDYIPKRIFRLISKKEWKILIFTQINQIQMQVENQIQENKQLTKQHLYELEFLNTLYKNQQHGMKIFKVKLLRTELFRKIEIPDNVFLGIKYNELLLFENQQNILSQFSMQQLQGLKIMNNILELNFLGGCIKLKQEQIFEAYRLLEEYQQISLIQQRHTDMVDTNDVSQII